MDIKDLCRESHRIAREKGWWETERNPLEILMLVVGEVAEASEEFRKNKPGWYEVDGKPEGWLVELADAYIRIADFVGQKQMEKEFIEVLNVKMKYNESRPYRHGNKKY